MTSSEGRTAGAGKGRGRITRRSGASPRNGVKKESLKGLATRAIHAGSAPDPATGASVVPIYQTASYVFRDTDHAASLFNLEHFGPLYSRITNPTVQALEKKAAALDGGIGAIACASGHAAQFLAFLPLMEPGTEFVASTRLYGGSITQFAQSFARLGWTVRFADPDNPRALRAAINEKTRALFTESLSNPGGSMVDIERLASLADRARIPLLVDNTLATPALFCPFDWGATLALYSTTKFYSGHGNSLGGLIVDSGRFVWDGRHPQLTAPHPAYHGTVFSQSFGPLAFTVYGHAVGLRDFGPAMAPMNAFLTMTGAETLPLRMRRHSENALGIARWLKRQKAVRWVSYAGLSGDSRTSLARRYLPHGAGGVLTFGVMGGFEAGRRLVESCRLFTHLANIGDTRSLILHPASTTHRQLDDEARAMAGAGADVIRLSVGLEDVEDLIADLRQALRHSQRKDR